MIRTRSPIELDVTEGHRLEPVDADEDVRVALVVATGQVELLAARRADADEDRVEALGEQRAQAGDRASCSGCRRPCRG